jgi:glycosyltransferase involved in cell wall biosynthesis
MTADAPSIERTPVLHALHTFGLPSETFVRDAIVATQALGWTPWVVAESVVARDDVVPPERFALPPRRRALVDRVGRRIAIGRGVDPTRTTAAHDYLGALAVAPPGILHAHFGWTGADCALAARKLRLPFVVSFHGTDLTVDARHPAWARTYAAMLDRVDRVTVVSRFLEGKLRGLGFDRPVDILPAGVRLERFPFSGGPRPGEAPRLLFVGRLIPCKGVDVLLAAVARLHAEGTAATLRIVGEGPERAALQVATKAHGLAGAVAFRGGRNHDEVRSELQQTDVLVVPSRTMPDGQAEGSPVVPKEAQAIGVPVVATTVGGTPETIPPRLRHELVAPDDPQALAAAILDLWQQRLEWPGRVRLQREWVEAEFSWDKLAARLSRIYETLSVDRPPGRAQLARALRSR